MKHLEDYREIVGDHVITEIYGKARKLYGKHIIHINSTFMGGGVAEMLLSIAPLMNYIGLNADWVTFHGNQDFFTLTKKIHNALQGDRIHWTKNKVNLYLNTSRNFSIYTHIGDNYDLVIIHDPQPLPLIRFYKKVQPWVWRCHVDLSHPNETVWNFLKSFILRYDLVIVSNEKYKNDIPIKYKIIYPAIDPLSLKNMELDYDTIRKYIKKFKIPTDKPLITQISRFDKWKDPEGVIEVFKIVKEKVDARLVLCGSMATDDPEGYKILEKVKKKAKRLIDKGDLILLTYENNVLVNVLQRISSVIIQKSIKEGFGLTVTEALWKGKPVVASRVGGITLQIEDGVNGFLVDPMDYEGAAQKIIEILKNPELAEELGKRGKETVREKFLITRLLSDYLDVFNELIG